VVRALVPGVGVSFKSFFDQQIEVADHREENERHDAPRAVSGSLIDVNPDEGEDYSRGGELDPEAGECPETAVSWRLGLRGGIAAGQAGGTLS
jgi:hypothetical protein